MGTTVKYEYLTINNLIDFYYVELFEALYTIINILYYYN